MSHLPLLGNIRRILFLKRFLSCERIRVAGHSRSKLGSYANSFQVTLAPSVVIPERLHSKIQVCFHWNASLGLCECEKDEWKVVRNGLWSSVMSPYEDKYVDVKFIGGVSGSVAVSVEEDFKQWRLLCLALGFVLLLFAPIASSWVPFYYSSSMAIGVFLVIIILLFQGMRLLPTGRKNMFYLTIYSSVIGAGSYLLHHFSMLINAFFANFGLSEEMHNPVSLFVLVGVILAGAALGYWIVRKFVISEDGYVDVGIAQFMKWAMRIIAMALIFQSTLDTPLAVGALVSCSSICFLITSKLHGQEGYKRFYRRAVLETSDFLKDDCLRINCAVGVVVSAVDFSSLHSIPVPESDSGADFGFMLEHDETADVVFDVSGEKFHAHKLVLTARSSVFEAEFFEGNENDSNEIVVKDMEPKVFKALLHFIYKDNLTVEDELMSTSSPMPSVCNTLAGKLLAAADKYGLARLGLMCEFLLCKDISVNSVARILDLAESYQAMDLKAVCLKFAAENLEAVMRSDGFAYLKENCPFLQSELLKSIAGCEEECSGGGKSQSVLAQFSDGDNITGKTWECGNGEGSRSLWVKLLDGGDTKVESSRQHP